MIAQVKTKTLEDLDISQSRGTLAEAQTQVSFTLVQEGEVTADGSGALSATWGVYLKEQGGSKVTVWAGIGQTDTGSTDRENGDDYAEGSAGRNTFTIKSIAACAHKQSGRGIFEGENQARTLNLTRIRTYPSFQVTGNPRDLRTGQLA